LEQVEQGVLLVAQPQMALILYFLQQPQLAVETAVVLMIIQAREILVAQVAVAVTELETQAM
jgi:hypothetical protein